MQEKNSFAFVVRSQILPGHVLVCPRDEKVTRMRDLSTEQLFEFSLAIQAVNKVVQKCHGTDSTTISIQEGLGFGQLIDHLHVHIIPRK